MGSSSTISRLCFCCSIRPLISSVGERRIPVQFGRVVPVSESVAPRRASVSPFTRYAWAVLGWNFFVVLWGAYVRASGSGAGCGSHWPLCNGEVVPRAPRLETIIEFTHRMTSGVALVAVIGLAIWSVYAFPRGHRVRRTATLSVVFLVLEA